MVTRIDFEKDKDFFKKSKKYAEIYIKQNKEKSGEIYKAKAMEEILKASNYETAISLVQKYQGFVKNWSDVIRFNILLRLIRKHFKSKSKDKDSDYIFNLEATSMKAQDKLPGEFTIGKDTADEKAKYKKNSLHLLITGVDRLLKQGRAVQAYNTIMAAGEGVQFTSTSDKLKHAMGRVTQAEINKADQQCNEADKALNKMLTEIENCTNTKDLPNIVQKYAHHDSRNFDIVRPFLSVFSDESLSEDAQIGKLYQKINKWKRKNLYTIPPYNKLYDFYYRYLYGYLNLEIDEKLTKLGNMLQSDPTKESMEKVKTFVDALIPLFDRVKEWGIDENKMYTELGKAQNILDKCSREERIEPDFYRSNQLSSDWSDNCASHQTLVESLSPLFEYVTRVVPDSVKAEVKESESTKSSSKSIAGCRTEEPQFIDNVITSRCKSRPRGRTNTTPTPRKKDKLPTQKNSTQDEKRDKQNRYKIFGY